MLRLKKCVTTSFTFPSLSQKSCNNYSGYDAPTEGYEHTCNYCGKCPPFWKDMEAKSVI